MITMLMSSPGPQFCPLHQRVPLIRPETLRRLALLRAGRHPPVSRAAWDHRGIIRETETETRITIIMMVISGAHLAAWTLALGAKLPVKKLVSSTRPCTINFLDIVSNNTVFLHVLFPCVVSRFGGLNNCI